MESPALRRREDVNGAVVKIVAKTVEWAAHPASPKIWLDDLTYREADRAEYLRLMEKLLVRTKGDLSFSVWRPIMTVEPNLAQEIARSVLAPERLLTIVEIVISLAPERSKDLPGVILTKSWWKGLGKEGQTKLLMQPSRQARELLWRAVGSYERGTDKEKVAMGRGQKRR